MSAPIVFNKPFHSELELRYLAEAIHSGKLSGDGEFTKKCNTWLKENLNLSSVFLTHSCTAALEMSAMLLDLKAGDEVIMPSFTFVSTANAVVLRGATPVFIDIRPDTLNMNEAHLEMATTKYTRAVMPVHYAGVGCEMDSIMDFAKQSRLAVVEDAAQALFAKYKGKHLGTIGDLGAYSFHDTKNIVSGEGGALCVNDIAFSERAEIIREKGTNRSRFFRGQVDKYTWVDVGSSYLPSELNAAHLLAQFQNIHHIQGLRMQVWNTYHQGFQRLENKYGVRRPIIPAHCEHNAHMYYLICRDLEERSALLSYLNSKEIKCTFHYVPLHSSPAGKKFGRFVGDMKNTDTISDRLFRVPLWPELKEAERVIEAVDTFYSEYR